MNQRDFGVPDVRCYDRALFAAVKCLALYCRSQIFYIEAASQRTREKCKGRFAVQVVFFLFLLKLLLCQGLVQHFLRRDFSSSFFDVMKNVRETDVFSAIVVS